MPVDWHAELKSYCDKKDITLFNPFDESMVDVWSPSTLFYKVASYEIIIRCLPRLRRQANRLFYQQEHELSDIEMAVSVLEQNGCRICTSSLVVIPAKLKILIYDV
jgi:sialic acid synthase SpsE